jgi:hypothetical protein
MSNRYEVSLWEDEVIRNQAGEITHHPFYGLYGLNNELKSTHGYLSFLGDIAVESPWMEEIKVFVLEFKSDPYDDDRESWADPFRIAILKRLRQNHHSWYLSLIGWMPDKTVPDGFIRLEDYFQETVFKQEGVNFTSVSSEKRLGIGQGFWQRTFVEIPNKFLEEFFLKYWDAHSPGHPIEGYNFPSGRIDLLKKWDKRPRDADLFREVLNECFVAFYTDPAENRDLVFVTNKLTMEQFQTLINYEQIEKSVKQLG